MRSFIEERREERIDTHDLREKVEERFEVRRRMISIVWAAFDLGTWIFLIVRSWLNCIRSSMYKLASRMERRRWERQAKLALARAFSPFWRSWIPLCPSTTSKRTILQDISRSAWSICTWKWKNEIDRSIYQRASWINFSSRFKFQILKFIHFLQPIPLTYTLNVSFQFILNSTVVSSIPESSIFNFHAWRLRKVLLFSKDCCNDIYPKVSPIRRVDSKKSEASKFLAALWVSVEELGWRRDRGSQRKEERQAVS